MAKKRCHYCGRKFIADPRNEQRIHDESVESPSRREQKAIQESKGKLRPLEGEALDLSFNQVTEISSVES